MEKDLIKTLECWLYKNRVFSHVPWWQRLFVIICLLLAVLSACLLPYMFSERWIVGIVVTLSAFLLFLWNAVYLMDVFASKVIVKLYPQYYQGVGKWDRKGVNDAIRKEMTLAVMELKLKKRAMRAMSDCILEEDKRIDKIYGSGLWMTVGSAILTTIVEKPIPLWTPDRIVSIAWLLVFLLIYVFFLNTKGTVKDILGVSGRLQIRQVLNDLIVFSEQRSAVHEGHVL